MAETSDELWGLIEPWLTAERLELDDLELSGAGRGRVLRIVVDDQEGPVGVDRLAEVSESLSRLLDAESGIEGSYQLEVTSPGLERKLRRRRHYEKSVGREVSVKVRGPEGSVVAKGDLVEAGPEEFAVASDGEVRRFAYGDVISARTVFRWEKAPKPGKKR